MLIKCEFALSITYSKFKAKGTKTGGYLHMEQYGMRFEEMDKKQKINHIWEYYRYHILAVIIGVAVIGALGKTILFPEPPDDVDIMFAGQMYIDETAVEITENLKEEYGAGIDFSNVNWEGDVEVSSLMFQKIPLMITTDELDVMAIATSTYEHFATIYGQDMFMPLEDIPELSGLLEKYKDNLYICDKAVDDEGNLIDTEPHVLGIKTDTFSDNLSCIVASEEMIVGLNPQPKDLDKTISMLKYILE